MNKEKELENIFKVIDEIPKKIMPNKEEQYIYNILLDDTLVTINIRKR